MAAVQHFRSAFNGFNREDVVHYIEYLNNQHKSQLEQLNTQLQTALAKAAPTADADLQAQLDVALARCTELEQQLTLAQQETQKADISAEEELEIYRRAERTERLARERAQQIYTQANAALAEAALQAESASTQIGAITDRIVDQLKEYQQSVAGTKDTFQQAAAALYAIKPEE